MLSRAATSAFLDRYPAATGNTGGADVSVSSISWATTLIKSYNRPAEPSRSLPFAGLTVTPVRVEPPAIGVADLGLIAF